MKRLPRPVSILSRLLFTPFGIAVGVLCAEHICDRFKIDSLIGSAIVLILGGLVVGTVFFFVGELLCRLIYDAVGRLTRTLKQYSGREIIAGGLGLICGMFLASLVNKLFEMISVKWMSITLSTMCYVFFAFVGLILGINYLKAIIITTDVTDNNVPKLLDTSALIDGRILGVTETGFVEGPFIIPAFVVSQLQSVADSEDLLKRSRGRRGLDIINELQKHLGTDVIIDDSEFPDTPDIDGKLLKLAVKLKGVIITVDFNLNKVASVKKIKVLNLNELSNDIKPVAIPGEKVTLTILKEGKERGQGVSYLEDGTMVVIENGGDYVGKTAVVTITTSLQTNAGRIIFGRIIAD